MPYDGDAIVNLSTETDLPDFPLSGFKIVRQEQELQSHLETAIQLIELLEIMHRNVYGNSSGKVLEDTCRNDKSCIADLIYQYGSGHIQDYTGDGVVNCDDLAVLLYAHQHASSPTTIVWFYSR